MEDPISIHNSAPTFSRYQHHQLQQPAHHPTTSQQKPFEFTRKKRWADTVVAELVDIAILVFSQQGAILHCDAAVNHVLGYTEDQLLGSNFTSFLHGKYPPAPLSSRSSGVAPMLTADRPSRA